MVFNMMITVNLASHRFSKFLYLSLNICFKVLLCNFVLGVNSCSSIRLIQLMSFISFTIKDLTLTYSKSGISIPAVNLVLGHNCIVRVASIINDQSFKVIICIINGIIFLRFICGEHKIMFFHCFFFVFNMEKGLSFLLNVSW